MVQFINTLKTKSNLRLLILLIFSGVVSTNVVAQNGNPTGNGGNPTGNGGNPNILGDVNNPYLELYVNDFIKIGQNSLWLSSGLTGNNDMYTTNGPLVINPIGVSVGGGPSSTGENTLINPDGGKVGIGTRTPDHALNVIGTTHYQPQPNKNLNIGGFEVAGPGSMSLFTYNDGNTALIPLGFQASKFVFGVGNIGVGTTTPTAKLDVNGAIAWGQSGASLSTDQGAAMELRGTGSPYLDFTNDASTDYDMRMQLTGDNTMGVLGGDVGIGTTTPSAKLDVNGDVAWGSSGASLSTDEGAAVELRGTGTPYFDFSNDASIDYDMRIQLLGDDAIGILGGNVGIGTTTPTNKLDINGNVGITSNDNIYLRDANHGLGYYGASKLFAGNNPDGPVLFGYSGGVLGVKQGATEINALNWKSNGDIGIGTSTPSSKLHVSGGYITIEGGNPPQTQFSGWNVRLATPLESAWVTTNTASTGHYLSYGMGAGGWYWGGSLQPIGSGVQNDMTYAMHLGLDGILKTRGIFVTQTNWPDYVFEEDYNLTPLTELEDFITINKHLPGVPSEQEVLEEGVNLGNMDAILLQKIEELTLHIIEQDKRIKELENK